MHACLICQQGEDLDFAYDSISAFSARRDNQEAVFGTEEGLKEIRYKLSCASNNINIRQKGMKKDQRANSYAFITHIVIFHVDNIFGDENDDIYGLSWT